MNDGFEKAVALVLKHEGGYVHDHNDPGGETKYGISKRSYPNEDIQNLTVDRAKDIYFNDFWLPLLPFELPEPVAILLFDMAVNMGKVRAAQCLQRATGVQADGVIGPVTRAAIRQKVSREFMAEITAQRILYYASLETFDRFGPGWTRRSLGTLLEVL